MTREYLRNRVATLAAVAGALIAVSACATTPTTTATISTQPPPVTNAVRTTGDPRIGLRPGATDAGVAAWNMRLVANAPTPTGFVGVTNSDLAFSRNFVIQGNYNGVIIWDVSNPAQPRVVRSYLCPASQSDVSVVGNLLFVSGEGLGGRVDCGTQGVPEPVSRDRLRGIRIFDITDITNARYIHNVQTCRGSHTHTVVTPPSDRNNVYVYISGSAGVRPADELPGCAGLDPRAEDYQQRLAQEAADTSSSYFRIEVIRVPKANPQQAAVVSGARIFTGLTAPPRRNQQGEVVQPAGGVGPTQCHDITVYPAVGLGGGACGGYGLLLDLSDVTNPRRIDAAADPNMSFWHSATFSNDGDKLLFSDEWGGGGAPRCRATDRFEWGSNAIFTIQNRRNLQFHSYYKMPAAQTELENCVAHNGSLIPIPGREVMVQGWYQGGVSVFDWTDPARPFEIAYFDRGPVDPERMRSAGSWSAYWYNGLIYSSEIARGLDVFELTPSEFLTQNEIDAAKTVRFDEFNAQDQQKFVWPPSFALARAYLDQLQRSQGLSSSRLAAARAALARAESQMGAQRGTTLMELATQLSNDTGASGDAAKVRLLASAVRELANAR